MPDIETLRRILGERCYPSLADIGHEVDMVGVFRRAEDVMPVARQAIEIGAKALWQQFGVANLEGADRPAREHELDTVLDRFVTIGHARLFGGLNWVGVDTQVISAKRPRWLP